MLARALIVLFSVLNLGVAAWWFVHDPAQPAAPVELPAGVARLQLVSEVAGARIGATDTASSRTPPPEAAPRCYALGPFATAQAPAAAARLQPRVAWLRLREEFARGAGARGWRVFLPPLASRDEAQATAQRIGAAGFDDFLVVPEGAEANSIALGRYRSEQGARSRARSLAAAGFPARVAPIGDGGATMVWLDVRAGAGFDPRAAQTLTGAAQYHSADCATLR